MRWDDMYISGTGACVPDRELTSTAVAEGRYDPDEYEVNAYVSVGVSGGSSAAEMAAAAARQAFGRSGAATDDIAMVLHASFYHQGQDHWTPASYIQQESVGGRAPAIEVKQASNGSLAALVLAMSYLSADSEQRAALITTADRFCLPGYDRYRTDKWIVLADGATGAVVSRQAGFARVRSTAMDADPTMEELYRGGDGFTDGVFAAGQPLDLRGRKREYVSRVGFEHVATRASSGLLNAVKRALTDAGAEINDISKFVLPNVGRALFQWEFLDVLGIEEKRTTWDWGSTVGHGAGDQLGGLNYLAETGALNRGDLVMLASSGIGFNWNCAVVEILDRPAWNQPGGEYDLGRAVLSSSSSSSKSHQADAAPIRAVTASRTVKPGDQHPLRRGCCSQGLQSTG
jgi:3-oxoacyl-[acyl-carrier-protein] synthase-3